MDADYHIGLMSGTSFDGVDAVLVKFLGQEIKLVGSVSHPFPDELKTKLMEVSDSGLLHRLENVYSLDVELGQIYAQTVEVLLKKTHFNTNQIKSIGLHGQTIRHYPNHNPPFTTQIGDPNVVVAMTGIPTVGDFRRADLAHGGQGAPLAPAFHREFFHSSTENRAVVNIGGFANVTLLPASGKVTGFDTGPGNVFLDAWISKQKNQSYDDKGAWAATGKIHHSMLTACLEHPFFAKHPPKSTGRDEFDLHWLNHMIVSFPDATPVDIQATLTELTAVSIARSIAGVQAVYFCGGGALNHYLLSRISEHLPKVTIHTTEALGLHPQLVEPTLIAWLAERRMNNRPVDLRDITGSDKPVLLGGVWGHTPHI